MYDPLLGPRGNLRHLLFWLGLGLIAAFVLLCYKIGDDWRWGLGSPALFGLGYLWIKLWAWIEGIDRDGLTPEDRAQRDRENGNWE